MSFLRPTPLLAIAVALAAAAPSRAAPAPEQFTFSPGPATFTVEGHRVEIRSDTAIVLDGVRHELAPAAWKARITRTAHEHTGTTLTVIAEFDSPTTRHDKPVWDFTGAMVAKIDLAAKQVTWRHHLRNASRERTWSFIVTPDLLFVRERRGLVALDRTTGTETWRLDHDHMRSILVPLIYDTMKLDGATLTVAGHYYDGEARIDFAREFDAPTGLRVYRKLAYTAPTPQPIYVRPDYRLEYPSDRAPPVQPTEWDGVSVGYAGLVWNVKTGEGIIVNPTRNDARAIIAAAKRQPKVRWLAVYDTRAAIKQSKFEGKTPPHDDNQITLKPEGEILDSGEIVETREVAAALGAKIMDRDLETPLVTKAGPVTAYHPINFACPGGCPGDELEISLVWGPYRFVDEFQQSYRSVQ
ncbi:MAG: hypothetical protein ABI867_02995 [Kofleriaceae bacterium]